MKPREKMHGFCTRGCSKHMCVDKGLFCELNVDFRHTVKLGNNTRMSVVGKGTVRLQMNGFNHVVAGVYYILESNY